MSEYGEDEINNPTSCFELSSNQDPVCMVNSQTYDYMQFGMGGAANLNTACENIPKYD